MKFVCKIFLILAGLALCSAKPESINRISDGNLASKGQFPYMVSLQRIGDQQSQPTRGHSCSGALVSYQSVVTTALCLHTYSYASGNLKLLNQNEFRVFAGSNLLNDDSSTNFVRPIRSLTVHPNFGGLPTLVNDIAVIIVANEFPRGVVTPLALPGTNYNPAHFTQCTVAGWGSVDQSNMISTQLMFATKFVNDQNICREVFSILPGTQNILPSMICAVSSDFRSSNCYGDLGNPLVCGNTFTGILSSSDNCTVTTIPQIYTRISYYSTWIRSVSGAQSLINPGILALLLFSFIISLF